MWNCHGPSASQGWCLLIKVNLLKNLGNQNYAGESTVSQSILIKDFQNEEKVKIIWKIFFLAFPAVILIYYQSTNIGSKEGELAQINSKFAQIESEISVLTTEYDGLKKYKEEGDNLNRLIGTIAFLSKKRLMAIRSLDSLQAITPNRVWFTSLNFSDAKMNIQGIGVSSEDVTQFIKEVDDSVFFDNVETVNVEQVKKKYGNVKKFELNFSVAGPDG